MATDILEELDAACAPRVGSGDSDVNVMMVSVSRRLLERAIAEIKRLRSLTGAATDGQSFREIKESL